LVLTITRLEPILGFICRGTKPRQLVLGIDNCPARKNDFLQSPDTKAFDNFGFSWIKPLCSGFVLFGVEDKSILVGLLKICNCDRGGRGGNGLHAVHTMGNGRVCVPDGTILPTEPFVVETTFWAQFWSLVAWPGNSSPLSTTKALDADLGRPRRAPSRFERDRFKFSS
jgi:hypothetical protein